MKKIRLTDTEIIALRSCRSELELLKLLQGRVRDEQERLYELVLGNHDLEAPLVLDETMHFAVVLDQDQLEQLQDAGAIKKLDVIPSNDRASTDASPGGKAPAA